MGRMTETPAPEAFPKTSGMASNRQKTDIQRISEVCQYGINREMSASLAKLHPVTGHRVQDYCFSEYSVLVI
jgi:hypothetical protein